MLRGSYPAELLAETRHLTDWAFVADGDLAEINAPIDSLGVNFYTPTTIAAATDELRGQVAGRWSTTRSGTDRADPPGPAPTWRSRCRSPARTPAWAGRSGPQALTDLLLRVHRDYPDLPLMHHRERRRLRRRGRPGRRGARRRPDRLPARAPGRGARRDRGRRRRPRATTCGRCWTTSSGPGATPSGSAWSRRLPRACGARPKDSALLVSPQVHRRSQRASRLGRLAIGQP